MGVRSTRVLEADGIADSLRKLGMRIKERFPDSGLSLCCSELIETAEQTAARAETIRRPNYLLRAFTILVIAAAAFGIYRLGSAVGSAAFSAAPLDGMDVSSAAQALDSIVNLLVVVGVVLWTTFSLEARFKRQFALRHLHELRSHAHVIDVRQLTKDPISIQNPTDRTESSPERDTTPFELARYLSYCTEMLSFTGKLAELYAQSTSDTEILAAANDVETLCSNITRKIWPKLTILNASDLRAPR